MYPKTHQAILYFLYKYRKPSIVIQPNSKGSKFAQKIGNMGQGRGKKTYDKSTGRQKNASNVTRKVTRHLIV